MTVILEYINLFSIHIANYDPLKNFIFVGIGWMIFVYKVVAYC